MMISMITCYASFVVRARILRSMGRSLWLSDGSWLGGDEKKMSWPWISGQLDGGELPGWVQNLHHKKNGELATKAKSPKVLNKFGV